MARNHDLAPHHPLRPRLRRSGHTPDAAHAVFALVVIAAIVRLFPALSALPASMQVLPHLSP